MSEAGRSSAPPSTLPRRSCLHGHEGESLSSVITDIDQRGARIQLCRYPVVARVDAQGAEIGDDLQVKLVSADPDRRELRFTRA